MHGRAGQNTHGQQESGQRQCGGGRVQRRPAGRAPVASAAAHCVAVGDSSATVSGAVSPLTEVWNGTTWTVVTAPR
jgi:hypothetical protein